MRLAKAGLLLGAIAMVAVTAAAQDRSAQFRELATRLASQRLAGGSESEAAQAGALALVDALVLEQLNATPQATLDAANAMLAELSTGPAVGQSYRLLPLGTTGWRWYLLAANFGLAGPSAVRLYATPAEGGLYRLVSRIDRFAQQEYFDEFLAVVPVAAEQGVFVTVTGRTDELETGSFVAWRFDGARVERLWSTDLLERSRYEVANGEFRLTHCEEPDEDDPSRCAQMMRQRFVWRSGLWRQIEQREIKP